MNCLLFIIELFHVKADTFFLFPLKCLSIFFFDLHIKWFYFSFNSILVMELLHAKKTNKNNFHQKSLQTKCLHVMNDGRPTVMDNLCGCQTIVLLLLI